MMSFSLQPFPRWLAAVVVLAALYYLAARVGLSMAFASSNATPVWPPSGIAFAAILLFGRRLWPGVALGAFLANAAVFAANGVADTGATLAVSLAIAMGNTVEALFGAWLLRRAAGLEGGLDRPTHVYKFVAVAATMCVAGAANGTVSLLAGSIAPASDAWTIFATWWLGDLAGILIVTPFVLAWRAPRGPLWPRRLVLEAVLGAGVLGLTLALLFGQHFAGDLGERALTYVLLPCIGWAAWRFGKRGVTLAMLVVTGSAVWGTTVGHGPFAAGTLNDALLGLEVFIALCSVLGMVLAADLEHGAASGAVRTYLHWTTLFVCLGLTMVAWHFIASGTEQRAQDRFSYAMENVRQNIAERVKAYQQVLLAAQAMYGASQDVSREEWRRYVAGLNLAGNYPGIQGFGFAQHVHQHERAALEAAVVADGYPDFMVWPAGERARHVVVKYLEPFEAANLRAFGYDMMSEQARRSALMRSAQSGRATATGRVVLVQERTADAQTGFLVFLPVYRKDAPLGSPAMRMAALEGFVYAPFRMGDLMRGVLGPGLREVRMEIFDGAGAAPANLMYSSEPPAGAREYPNPFVQDDSVSVAGTPWLLRVTSLPAFEASVDREKALIVLIGGTIISLLFFHVVRALTSTREQARQLATQMTEALQDSEIKFGALVASASEFSIVATDLDGVIRIFSVGAERMLGYRADEVVGLHTPAIFHLEEEVRGRARSLSAQFGRPIFGFGAFVELARQGHPETLGWTYVRKDGSRLQVQLTVTAIVDSGGRITGFLGIGRDVTDQKRAEHELMAALERADKASRAKSEFVANMSHELRTPMNAVLGITHLLGKTRLSAEQRRDLDMIAQSGQALLSILNDILDFSKVEAGRMELAPAPFRLEELLHALASIMSVSCGEKELELVIGVAPDVPALLVGDSQRLQQVLVNLAGNAIKFTDEGEVSVYVETTSALAAGPALRFTVRDSGMGIGAEHRARLFSPFTQADSSMTRRFGGTGLGLAISRSLVELMGGTIELDSELGVGSQFRVIVPLQAVGAAQVATPAAEPIRVLLVDPHPTSRRFLRSTIANLGWQVDCAAGSAAALVLLGERGARHDVVLLDFKIHGMPGDTTLEQLRAIAPAMPVIVMATAYGRGQLAASAMTREIDACLIKPVTGLNLCDSIQEARAYRAGVREFAPGLETLVPGALQGRLLLVEDNALNQAVAKAILEQAGLEVDIVENGLQAVERLRTHAAEYRLVLMDVQMPVMDGFTATRLIRDELGLALPVLAMTAGVLETERSACLASGMNDFIAKPIDVTQMLSTIARYLDPALQAAAQSAPAQAVPAGTEGVLDLAQLMESMGSTPAGTEILRALLGKIVAAGMHEMHAARACWDDGRGAEAARMLHAVRGAVGSFGSRRFSVAALALEAGIRDGARERIPGLFDVALREYEAVLEAARDWLAGAEQATDASSA